MGFSHSIIACLGLYAVFAAASPRFSGLSTRAAPQTVVNRTSCNGETYTYQQLAGYGFVPSNARDKYGDTLGGYGSAIALDRRAWKKTKNGSYTGLLWAIPDRGWYVAIGYLVALYGHREVLIGNAGTQKVPSTTRIASINSTSPLSPNQTLPSPTLRAQICKSPMQTPSSSPGLMERLPLVSTPT